MGHLLLVVLNMILRRSPCKENMHVSPKDLFNWSFFTRPTSYKGTENTGGDVYDYYWNFCANQVGAPASCEAAFSVQVA